MVRQLEIQVVYHFWYLRVPPSFCGPDQVSEVSARGEGFANVVEILIAMVTY
jgi:hypothetical protein